METWRKGWTWFRQTSTIIGIPVLLVLVLLGAQKMIFTATCYTVGWRCEFAFGATDAMAQYMGELLAANPNVDIVAQRRK